MTIAGEIRKQIEKNKELKLAVGEINNHLSILEGLVRKDIMEQVDEAYQKGYDAGIIASSFVDKSDEAYQRGLDDAWEAAKKILQMYDFTVFGLGHDGVFESPLNEGQQMTPQEAIEKLKAYEEKQKADDKIEVGDEVADKDGDKTIVTNIHGDLFDGLCSDGSTMTDLFLDDNHKTGRHFDIAKILEEMQCGQ